MKQTPAVFTLDIDTSLSDSFSIGSFDPSSFPEGRYFRITFNQIILVKKGRGTIRIDEVDYPLKSNSLILAGKNQVLSFSKHQDVAGYNLCFGDCFWDKTPQSANNCKAVLFNTISSHQHVQLQGTDLGLLSRLFRDVSAEYSSADYINKGDALAAFLKIMMIKIANIHSLLSKETTHEDHQLYSTFLRLLEQQYERSHDVGYFAGQLHISARKLTELCHRYAGKGAKEVIKALLISEAKRSLQFTSSSIKEIAIKLNFSPYQFSHFFKKHTSLPPESYRKQWAEIDS